MSERSGNSVWWSRRPPTKRSRFSGMNIISPLTLCTRWIVSLSWENEKDAACKTSDVFVYVKCQISFICSQSHSRKQRIVVSFHEFKCASSQRCDNYFLLKGHFDLTSAFQKAEDRIIHCIHLAASRVWVLNHHADAMILMYWLIVFLWENVGFNVCSL